MLVPEPQDLLRRLPLEHMVPLPALPLPVLPPQQDGRDAEQASGAEDEPQRHAVAQDVPRLVLRAVDEGRKHAGAVAQRQERALARRPLVVARQVVRDPRHRQARGDIQTRRDDHAARVPRRRRRTAAPRAQQHRVPRARRQAPAHDERAAAARPVRRGGHGQVRQRAERVARDREQLRVDAAVAERVDDGRQEDAVAVEHDEHAELAEGQRPHLPVAPGLAALLPVDAAVVQVAVAAVAAAAAADIVFHAAKDVAAVELAPHGDQGLLPLGQVGRAAGVVGEDKVRRGADEHGGDALDDHEPAPGAQPGHAVHVAHAEGHEPAARAGDGRRGEEVEGAPGELAPAVEEGQVQAHRGEEAGLAGAQQQPQRDELGLGLHEARAQRDGAPGHGQERDQPPGLDDLEGQRRGDLEGDVGDEEHADAELEVVALEAEVGFHAVQPGVAWRGGEECQFGV
ncbi:uncharacterized protein E0L32_000443 [Thyridium curvatum]|uniref:Uncharacterized protein n=1 Tax=Thyridium curvatum TaxID=1093900 RepID=A0A507B9H9_9PEZI|nr:uncharacterized protein E0L32_000443 [Thyridium curvatum]TPX14049.1 hypothetical protein E0L32_000443 [Thyridium curvatum]